jgi:hypothetical protein
MRNVLLIPLITRRYEDAQRRGDIGARANGRVLETAQEAWVNILATPVR